MRELHLRRANPGEVSVVVMVVVVKIVLSDGVMMVVLVVVSGGGERQYGDGMLSLHLPFPHSLPLLPLSLTPYPSK